MKLQANIQQPNEIRTQCTESALSFLTKSGYISVNEIKYQYVCTLKLTQRKCNYLKKKKKSQDTIDQREMSEREREKERKYSYQEQRTS